MIQIIVFSEHSVVMNTLCGTHGMCFDICNTFVKLFICWHTDIQLPATRGRLPCPTPTHQLTHSFTHSKLIGSRPSLTSPSYTESSPWQQSLAHYLQQGLALLEPKLPEHTWLTSQQTRVHVTMATTTWQPQLGNVPLHGGLIGWAMQWEVD